jgi:1-acyl-sn-glycerol-3-phosphate acyltransferase
VRGRGNGRGDGRGVAHLTHAQPWLPLYRAARWLVINWGRRVNGFEVAGRAHIPQAGGVLVVVNHLADIDGMFVASALPAARAGTHLVTARHHDASPVVRELLLRLGLEPVRTDGSETSGLRHARALLRDGGTVVVYPEGVPGFSASVQPFAHGAGWLALTPGITVIPTAIWGSHRAMRRGLPIGRGPVRVAFGAPVSLDDLEGGRGARVHEVTRRMRQRVQALVTALAMDDRRAG